MARKYPPYNYGRRLISDTLAELARSQPERLYASIPKTNVEDGFTDITFKDMERMSNALATWVQSNWGPSQTHETVAYMGLPDLTGVVMFFALIRNGYKAFFPSVRNPVEVNRTLLESTKCSKLIYAPEVFGMIEQLLPSLDTLKSSSFDEIFRMPEAVTGRSSQTYDEARNDPILILHSSGSTGLPKPITMTNATFAVLDRERFFPTVEGRINRDFSIWDFEEDGKIFTVFPYYHLSGFLTLVINPIFTESSTPVIGPASESPSGPLFEKILDQQDVRALFIPPSIAEQLLAEPGGIEYFEKLDFICYTGGPFSPSAGKRLTEVTNLVPLYGSTEAFQVPQLVPSKEDWAYMEWNPHSMLEMQAAEGDAYELVLFADTSTEDVSALNHNVPGATEWRTKDLFRRHPSKPSLWQYYGRRDDIVILSNGGKFNPVPMELIIGSNKQLSGVLVVGKGLECPILVLEPKSGVDPGALKQEIWPFIERANLQAEERARIVPGRVRTVDPGTFVRAEKGTVVRKLTEEKISDLVDSIDSRK